MESTLPAGWKSQLSVTQQKLYYINTSTNQRQWLIPTKPAQSTSTALSNGHPHESEIVDTLSGNESDDPFAEPRKTVKVCTNFFVQFKIFYFFEVW